MFKIVNRLALATVITALAASGAFASTIPESQDPIKVIKNDWTGQLFSTEVLGRMLQKMGYNIEYVSAGALPCLLYTSPSPRDKRQSRMPSSA